MLNRKVVLITGCSSGFGYLTALKFAREGWKVLATFRTIASEAEELKAIAAKEKLDIEVHKMDVTHDEEVKKCIQSILEKNDVDVLINNAGFGFIGPVEEFEIDEVKEQYEVNIYGVLRVTKALLPSMRKRKSGRIINISSVNGLLSFGLYGVYSSSKFALETLSEVLRFELQRFNIVVSIVEPGGFDTKFHLKGKKAARYISKDTVYGDLKNPLEKSEQHNVRNNPFIQRFINPQRVADRLYSIAISDTPKLRYKVGIDTHLYTAVKSIVPQFVWDWMLHKVYRW